MAKKQRPGPDMPESIDAVLDRAGESRFALYRPPIAARVWRDAVGARIADRSEPVLLERGLLVVKVASSVWASELSLLSDAILGRLRAKNIAVSEIRFRVGTITTLARPPERRITRKIPPPAPLPTELTRVLRTVGDQDLRETIALAASANLAWQKHVEEPPANATPRAARAPRSSETENDPPDQT